MEALELRTFRRGIAVFAALALAGGLAACGGGDDDGNQDTIKVGYAFGFDIGDTGDQVAFDQMEETTGIKPEFTEIGGGDEAVAALVNGDIDMAKVGYSDTINAIAQGADICMVLPANPALDLILASQPDIETLADVRGKRVMLDRPGPSISAALLTQDLQAAGLEEGDYEIGYLPDSQNRAAALQSGRIEVGSLETVDLNQLADLGAKAPNPSNAFAVRCDFAKDNPELMNQVVSGLLAGFESLYGPDGRAAWVAKAREGDLADRPEEVANRIYDDERELGYWPRGAPLTEAQYQQVLDFMANDIVEKPVPFEQAWDLTFWENAAKGTGQSATG
jgi:ABC-type nitrate/sulfonate/bicarbonate transport system substrate-binding protein